MPGARPFPSARPLSAEWLFSQCLFHYILVCYHMLFYILLYCAILQYVVRNILCPMYAAFFFYGMLYFITQVLVIVLRHGFDSVMFCSVRLCSPICYFIWFDYIMLCFGILYYIPLYGEIPCKRVPCKRIPYTWKSLNNGNPVKGNPLRIQRNIYTWKSLIRKSLSKGNPLVREIPYKYTDEGRPRIYPRYY